MDGGWSCNTARVWIWTLRTWPSILTLKYKKVKVCIADSQRNPISHLQDITCYMGYLPPDTSECTPPLPQPVSQYSIYLRLTYSRGIEAWADLELPNVTGFVSYPSINAWNGFSVKRHNNIGSITAQYVSIISSKAIVSKKLCILIFCQNFVKFRLIVKMFGIEIAKRTSFSEVYTFSTSPDIMSTHYRVKRRCSKLLYNTVIISLQ